MAEVLARFLLDRVSNHLDTVAKSFKDSLDITSIFHGDDAELIFLVDPDKEGLLVIVEDTTTLGPISLHTSNSQVSVSRHKEEVVINQLLADRLFHSSEWVILSSKFSSECLHSIRHQLLNSNTLLLGDSGRKSKSINGATNTDSGRVHWGPLNDVSLDLVEVHVRGVDSRGADSVVFLDQRIKNWGSYKAFAPVFDPLIQEYHGISPSAKHTSDMDVAKIKGNIAEDVPVHSCRIRVGRSIDGFGLSPGITKDQRLGVEGLMKNAVKN